MLALERAAMAHSCVGIRVRALRALIVVVAISFAGDASASQTRHSLSGNARYQIGAGLPLPISPAPLPSGTVVAIPGATVLQTLGPDPKRMWIPPSQLTAPGNPQVVGLALLGPLAFQVHTSVSVRMPAASAQLAPGGRTGPPTVTFCPGQVVGSFNPSCMFPGHPANTINGLMRYTRTSRQFGGPAQATFGGAADTALRVGSPAPCNGNTNPNCLAVFVLGSPLPSAPLGAPFGFAGTASPPVPPGLFRVVVTAGGVISSVVSTLPGSGLANPVTSFGGPWTTGRVTVSVTGSAATQIFTLTGSDNRVNGVGSLSLVAGSVSQRSLSGPNANRGWLNLTVGPAVALTPALSNLGTLLCVAALAGVGALRVAFVRHGVGAAQTSAE
jgi:hypothetical protein